VARQAAANAAAEAEGSAAARRARVIEALANGLIGKNFMETEEPGSAQAKLEAAIAGLEGVAEESAAHVEVLNSLGVLWANRGETQTSLELFERAIAAHAKARTEERVTSDAEALQRLEDQHTLTTFYLAQAYGNLGERTKSAAHCFETMRRQLARRGKSGGGEFAFDPAQWARNAVDLARYYSAVDRYEVAEHCLRAAEAILVSARHEAKLAREAAASKAEASASAATAAAEAAAVDVSDAPTAAPAAAPAAAEGTLVERTVCLDGTSSDKEASLAHSAAAAARAAARDPTALTDDEAEGAAALDLAWSELYVNVLKRAWLLRRRAAGEYPDEPDEDEREGVALGPLEGLSFTTLGLASPSAACAQPASVRTFEAARELFKLGSAHAARAKATFVLDGFVTHHFDVLEREANLYAQLAHWESDLNRRHAMHKRRIQLLQPPLEQLNERAYTQLVRQGLFDLATISAEMLEIRVSLVNTSTEPVAQRLRKLQKEITETAEACRKFLSRFDAKDGTPPAKVDEEQERAYITCRFTLARAHGKLPTLDGMTASLTEFECIDAYLRRNKVEGMEEEAKMCREMVELLPHKIAAAQKKATGTA
jgi:tetratricopeptide (TPR) repeat protein